MRHRSKHQRSKTQSKSKKSRSGNHARASQKSRLLRSFPQQKSVRLRPSKSPPPRQRWNLHLSKPLQPKRRQRLAG
jgi:hypothetical protein